MTRYKTEVVEVIPDLRGVTFYPKENLAEVYVAGYGRPSDDKDFSDVGIQEIIGDIPKEVEERNRFGEVWIGSVDGVEVDHKVLGASVLTSISSSEKSTKYAVDNSASFPDKLRPFAEVRKITSLDEDEDEEVYIVEITFDPREKGKSWI